MVEPWITVFGNDAIIKLFSKKFADKEKGLQECEMFLKDSSVEKTKETLRISCLVVQKAIQDKVLAVNVKGITLLETTIAEHCDLNFEGSAQLVSRTLFADLFSKVGDQNARVREATEDILLQMANIQRLIGPSIVLSYATKVAIESETKPKLAIGKLQLVHKLIERHAHQL